MLYCVTEWCARHHAPAPASVLCKASLHLLVHVAASKRIVAQHVQSSTAKWSKRSHRCRGMCASFRSRWVCQSHRTCSSNIFFSRTCTARFSLSDDGTTHFQASEQTPAAVLRAARRAGQVSFYVFRFDFFKGVTVDGCNHFDVIFPLTAMPLEVANRWTPPLPP